MPRALDRDARDLAKALYIQGVRFSVISQQVQVKEATLRTWAKRGNWPSLVTKSVQALNVRLERGLIVESRNSLQAMGEEIRQSLAAELAAQVKLLADNPARDLRELATTKGTQGRASVVKTIVETAAQVHGWDSAGAGGLVLIGDLSSDRPDRQTPALDIVAEVTTAAPEAQAEETPTGSVSPTGSVLPADDSGPALQVPE